MFILDRYYQNKTNKLGFTEKGFFYNFKSNFEFKLYIGKDIFVSNYRKIIKIRDQWNMKYIEILKLVQLVSSNLSV